MCDIAGIAAANRPAGDILGRTHAMTSLLQHRGPDDSGIEIVCESPSVVFGHTRLSIIDTSPAGHQPMFHRDSASWIVFNGEIYNYRELRNNLEALGQSFRTHTDTEVLIAAYAQWGSECLSRLRGIFAFAVWETQSRTLFAARDQLGVKPFYYWDSGGILAFASEVRALLRSELIPRRLDPAGLGGYLAFGSVQDPQTLVSGVKSLLPGHFLQWRDGRAVETRYWSLPDPAEVDEAAVPDLADIGAALEDATVAQTIADVPLGAFLSGGIDSTAVVALMQRAANTPVRTFSILFEEKHWDEREYSRLAASHIGTDHTELLLTGSDVQSSLAAALDAFDQPSVDGLNTYFVSKVTKESGLTVALSGVGGDEVFGGYDGHSRALVADRWGRRLAHVPKRLRRGVSRGLQRAPIQSARRYADFVEGSRPSYFSSRQLFGTGQIRELLAPDVAAAARDPVSFARIDAETSGYDPVNRAAAFELQTYMLSTLLRDTDQMSMAHALEVRVPLIDHRLVELLFRTPGAMKIHPSQPKPLLTLPLADAIPAGCVHRPKRGFELPFAQWLRESMHAEMRELFLGGGGTAPFESRQLAEMWRSFENGRLGWSRVWALYVASSWLQSHKISA